MAPTTVHRYEPRSVNTGIAFTILFASIACCVILVCCVWGFLVPYFRKKYFPPKPSRTKYNYHHQGSGLSIPLIRTPSRNQSRTSSFRRDSPRISMYNPRLQTPFPRMPSNPDSIVLPTFTPPKISSPAAHTSHSLFTPMKNTTGNGAQSRIVKSYTLPRVRSRERGKSNHMDKDFGDAKEYILALPEPLHLRSRNDVGQLVASSTLGRMPGSNDLSSSADKHLHPKKLFEQLKGRDPRDSTCSSSSMKAQEQNISLARDEGDGSAKDNIHPCLTSQDMGRDSENRQSDCAQSTITATQFDSAAGGSESDPYNASVAAMHRLRTYRSLVGAPPPEPLSRAGTLTRPKTPVVKMRDIYDKTLNENKSVSNTTSRNETISTTFQTTAGSSDRQSLQSSASSPPKHESETFTASTLSLLPTPLQIRPSDRQRSTSTSEKRNSRFTEELDEARPVASQQTTASQDGLQKTDDSSTRRTLKSASTFHRPRPSPLTLNADVRVPAQHRNLRYANSPTASTRLPHRRLIVGSMQASSTYSRDTLGLSVARTPITPEFASQTTYHPPFSPYLPSTIGAETDSDKGTEANLLQAKSSPAVSAAKRKVEDWNVDIGELYFNTSPSPSLKRALSNLGPACESTHEASTIAEDERPDPRHSTISTEMNPSEARLSSVVGAVRMSTCTERAIPHTAPGGAAWL